MKKHFLIATDGLPGACEAGQQGTALANEAGAAISLVSVRHSPLPVLGDPYHQRMLSAELARAQAVVEEAAPGVVVAGVEATRHRKRRQLTRPVGRMRFCTDRDCGIDRMLGRLGPGMPGSMKRVVVDHFGGPEVLRVVEDGVPRPGPGEVRVRVLAAGVSYTDAMLRAGTYLGVPKPPFTPGYELVGVVEELGPDCSRLRAGDRIGALTVWGADAERVCVLEENAVEVPDDLDPAQVLSLVFIYMTAHQLLHRAAKVERGETMLVHGAAGRVAPRRHSETRSYKLTLRALFDRGCGRREDR